VLHIAQAHHLIGQQFQRPALSPIRGLTTGQMNQLGLALAIQAAPFRTLSGKAPGESHLQVLLDKPLLDTNHGAATDVQHLGNLSIGVTGFALTLIAHQQDARHQVVLGRSTARALHRFQPETLLLAQSHRIVVVIRAHACTPSMLSLSTLWSRWLVARRVCTCAIMDLCLPPRSAQREDSSMKWLWPPCVASVSRQCNGMFPTSFSANERDRQRLSG